MFVFLLNDCEHLLSYFSFCYESSFCNRVMISCSIHGKDELYSCQGIFCVSRQPWWNNPLMVFGLHEYRPIYRFEASAVKAMRPILTHESSFQLILGFCTLHRSQHWKFNHPNTLLSLLHCDVYYGVEVRHTWRWESRIMSSPRVSSRNQSPNFVLWKDRFSFLQLDFVLEGIDIRIAAADRCCRCCFSRRPGFTRIVKENGFPMHAWRFIFVSTLFESYEPYSWYSKVGCDDSQHRLSKCYFLVGCEDSQNRLSKCSSFLRNFLNRNPPFHDIIKIHLNKTFRNIQRRILVLEWWSSNSISQLFLLVPIVSFHVNHDLSQKLFAMRWYFSVTNFSFMRDS